MDEFIFDATFKAPRINDINEITIDQISDEVPFTLRLSGSEEINNSNFNTHTYNQEITVFHNDGEFFEFSVGENNSLPFKIMSENVLENIGQHSYKDGENIFSFFGKPPEEYSLGELIDINPALNRVNENVEYVKDNYNYPNLNSLLISAENLSNNRDPNGDVTYSFLDNADGKFVFWESQNIDGVNTVFEQNEITTPTPYVYVAEGVVFDFEDSPSHTITIQAESHGYTNTANFTIYVNDDPSDNLIVENNPAVFTNPTYSGSPIAGTTLTSSIDYSDADGNSDDVVFTGWYLDDGDISNGVDTFLSDYTSTDGDLTLDATWVGQTLYFTKGFLDDAGNKYSALIPLL